MHQCCVKGWGAMFLFLQNSHSFSWWWLWFYSSSWWSCLCSCSWSYSYVLVQDPIVILLLISSMTLLLGCFSPSHVPLPFCCKCRWIAFVFSIHASLVFLNANKFLPFLPIFSSFECLQSLVFVVNNGGASSLHHMLFMF